jgi:hypothetical protein
VRRQRTPLVEVVDTLECCGVRDDGSALRSEQVSDWRTLLEGWAMLQIKLAFALHERNLLLKLQSPLLLVAYHLAHIGLCRDTLALGLEDLFLLLEVTVGVLGPTAHPGLPPKVLLGVGWCYRL